MQFIAYLIQSIHRRNFKRSREKNIVGMPVEMLRFADDIAVIKKKKTYKAQLTCSTKLTGTLKEQYMQINQRKTKVLVCSRQQIYENIA